MQFEVEAEEASAVEIDEVQIKVQYTASGSTISDATNSQISSVTLYKGSVSETNKLDQVS
jgi:hypothetical protein